MDYDVLKRIGDLEAKIDAIYASVEKTRKYFFWTMIVTVVLFVVPLIGLIFAVPAFMTNYVGSLDGSSLGI